MVVRGASSPDPSNRPNENFLPTDVGMTIASNSDSDEEEISYNVYEVLPQDIIENNGSEQNDSDSEDDSSEADEVNFTQVREPPSFDQSTKLELSELWNSSNNNRQTDIIIDSTKEQEIKNAMAGFTLPLSAIPSWAAQIPEQEWKEQLKNRVALLNKVPTI